MRGGYQLVAVVVEQDVSDREDGLLVLVQGVLGVLVEVVQRAGVGRRAVRGCEVDAQHERDLRATPQEVYHRVVLLLAERDQLQAPVLLVAGVVRELERLSEAALQLFERGRELAFVLVVVAEERCVKRELVSGTYFQAGGVVPGTQLAEPDRGFVELVEVSFPELAVENLLPLSLLDQGGAFGRIGLRGKLHVLGYCEVRLFFKAVRSRSDLFSLELEADHFVRKREVFRSDGNLPHFFVLLCQV